MKKVAKFMWLWIGGTLYFPIYVLAWVLHKVARLLLAVSYFGLLEPEYGKNIIKYLFKWHGKH